jgi:hypothetical protein
MRTVFVLTLATLVIACSQQGPPQSTATGQNAPAASPPSTAQAPTPESRPTGSAAAQTAPASNPAPAEPVAPPAPKFREVTIPAGTSLSVTVLSGLASNTSKVEDPVKGSLAKPITINGATVVPAGAQILGTVTDAKESGRVKGRASVAFRFDRLIVGDETHRIQTASVKREAAANTKDDVKKGALGGGAGAIVGGVVGGGKGAAIGAVAGSAGTVLATKGNEVEVPAGTAVTVLLQEPVTLTVPVK